jgi:5-methyltetrahydropteroyltriglutamate--homocysteine methyltransferase
VLAMAEMVNQEALALQEAGAKYIQIDEPAATTRPEEMSLVAEGLARASQGLTAKTITHICYGDFGKVFDQLISLPVDQLDIETANSDFDLLELIRQHKESFNKELAMGVVDVHNHNLESVEQVKDGIKRALSFLEPERLYIDPDCGLKTRTVEEAEDKLRVVVQAVREVKQELGID